MNCKDSNRILIPMNHHSSLPLNNKVRKPFKNLDGKGHRSRMRLKILSKGAAILEDYEILEVLLYSIIPRKDTKPVAKQLLNQFGSLQNVLMANKDELNRQVSYKKLIDLVLFIQQLSLRLCGSDDARPACFKRWNDMVAYLEKTYPEPSEIRYQALRVILLNGQYQVMTDFYTPHHKENSMALILQSAIQNDASRLVLIHYLEGSITSELKHQETQFSLTLQHKARFFDLTLGEHLFCINQHYVSIFS